MDLMALEVMLSLKVLLFRHSFSFLLCPPNFCNSSRTSMPSWKPSEDIFTRPIHSQIDPMLKGQNLKSQYAQRPHKPFYFGNHQGAELYTIEPVLQHALPILQPISYILCLEGVDWHNLWSQAAPELMGDSNKISNDEEDLSKQLHALGLQSPKPGDADSKTIFFSR